MLRAIIDANLMSERIADRRKLMDEAEGTITIMDFQHPLPESDDDEDYIDTGAAILAFYCTLVDLLGRCAPDSTVIALVRSKLKNMCHVESSNIREFLCLYQRDKKM